MPGIVPRTHAADAPTCLTPIALRAAERTNGWLARLRASGRNARSRVVGEFSAEDQQGRAAVAARARVSFAP